MDNQKFNKEGMIFFLVAFAAATAVFVISIYKNQGPIDQGAGKTIATGISHKEIVEREKLWRASSPEAIAGGQELYKTNCAYCHTQNGADIVLDRYGKKEVKFGSKETEIYKILVKGIPGAKAGDAPIKAAFSHVPAQSRWMLVHYLRSVGQGLPSATPADWSALDKEAIW